MNKIEKTLAKLTVANDLIENRIGYDINYNQQEIERLRNEILEETEETEKSYKIKRLEKLEIELETFNEIVKILEKAFSI